MRSAMSIKDKLGGLFRKRSIRWEFGEGQESIPLQPKKVDDVIKCPSCGTVMVKKDTLEFVKTEVQELKEQLNSQHSINIREKDREINKLRQKVDELNAQIRKTLSNIK